MPDIRNHPLFNRSSESNAALIEACGRVFAASLSSTGGTPAERNENATRSVDVFLDTLAKG
jgi:hypothetical protein